MPAPQPTESPAPGNEEDSPDTPASPKPKDDLGYNPAFGCIIGAAALMVFVGLAIFSFYVMARQSGAIDQFTQEAPVELPIASPSPEDTEAFFAGLSQYLEGAKVFDEDAKLRLSPDDLDHLIAAADPLADYRGLIDFEAILPSDDEAENGARVFARVSLPLRRMRFWEGPRYLVGEAEFALVRTDGSLFFYITGIEPSSGGEVAEGFLENLRHWPWQVPFQDDPAVTPILTNTRSVWVEDGSVVLSPRNPSSDDAPPGR